MRRRIRKRATVAIAVGYISFALLVSNCSQGTMSSDQYPGDAAYTGKLKRLLENIRDDTMDFSWHNQEGVSKDRLCKQLVERHFHGLNPGMSETNAEWLACANITQASVEEACVNALTNPRGFSSPAGLGAWKGSHKGTWYDVSQSFWDEAEWSGVTRNPARLVGHNASDGSPMVCSFQEVEWPNRKVGRFGWHQSHPEVNHVWGWDPKDIGNENGDIGTHIGFPFKIQECEFLIWITPKGAFLEGVNTGQPVTRTVNGRTLTGRPKTATALTGGRGQWLVIR